MMGANCGDEHEWNRPHHYSTWTRVASHAVVESTVVAAARPRHAPCSSIPSTASL